MNARGWLLLERVQASLPLLAVAGLAGFTWWLVQSSPREAGPAQAARVSSAPDYELSYARVARFDPQGRLEAVLDGDAMRHFPDTDRLQIDEVLLVARDEQGQGLRATGRQAEADQLAEVVTLRGAARVVATPASGAAAGQRGAVQGGPVRFNGEALRVDNRKRLVSSDQPVTLTQDGSVVRGQSMEYNDLTGVTLLGGRVTGHYDAPAR